MAFLDFSHYRKMFWNIWAFHQQIWWYKLHRKHLPSRLSIFVSHTSINTDICNARHVFQLNHKNLDIRINFPLFEIFWQSSDYYNIFLQSGWLLCHRWAVFVGDSLPSSHFFTPSVSQSVTFFQIS